MNPVQQVQRHSLEANANIRSSNERGQGRGRGVDIVLKVSIAPIMIINDQDHKTITNIVTRKKN